MCLFGRWALGGEWAETRRGGEEIADVTEAGEKWIRLSDFLVV